MIAAQAAWIYRFVLSLMFMFSTDDLNRFLRNQNLKCFFVWKKSYNLSFISYSKFDSESNIFSVVSAVGPLHSAYTAFPQNNLKYNRSRKREKQKQYLICIGGLWAGWGPTPVSKSKSSRIVAEVL